MKKVFVLLALSLFAISALVAQVYPPTNLQYQVQSQNNVHLTWNAPVDPDGIVLHYDDGINNDGIGTGAAADFDVAIRFEPSQIAAYDGFHLTTIDFFPKEASCSYSIRVWQGAGAADLIVDQPVANPTIDDWNSVALNTPVAIDASQELWFGFRANTQTGFPAGCDAGPAVAHYGDMIHFEGEWSSIATAFGLNYNWNIQGHVSSPSRDEVAVPLAHFDSIINNTARKVDNPFKLGNLGSSDNATNIRDFLGYNVYRNGNLLADMVATTSYSDMGLEDGTYTYYVTAMYDEGESDPTNTVEVVIAAGNMVTVLFENFEGGAIPADWTMTTHSAVGWFVTMDGSSQYWAIPPGDGYYACSNDDAANDDGSMDYLITPELNMANYNAAILTFDSYFTAQYSQTAHVKVSTDGTTWTEVGSVPDGTAWTEVEIDLGAYTGAGFEQVWVNFHANDNGAWASGWAVDNVEILGNMAGDPQYGTLNGYVYDEFEAPLAGATVEAGSHMTTTIADGSFEFAEISVGTYNVTASMAGYMSHTEENVAIMEDETTTVHFFLQEYMGDLDPVTNLEATVDENDVHLSWWAPGAGGDGDEFEEGFEGGDVPAGWLAIDNNGDGNNWFAYEFDPHSGGWSMASASWHNNVVLFPDNYLITPQIELGPTSELRWWAAAQDPDWPADHYKVRLSTTGTDPADFNTILFEETLSSSVWHEVVVDLSAYAGQMVYLAWHHTDCSDWFYMKIDDISVMNTATREVIFASDFDKVATKANNAAAKYETTRDLTGYNIYRDGTMIGNTTNTTYTDYDVSNGQYVYGVSAVYDEGESPLVTIDVAVDGSDAPDTNIGLVTALKGNYPNPFNPDTNIHFSTSEGGHVTIDIYNVKGQKVTTLVDERMDAGDYIINWNGKDDANRGVSSGIYFSRMRSGKYTSTKKMILMK